MSLCSFLREASSFQPSSLRMPDTLTMPCAPFAHLAPCLWTLSSLSMSRLRTGSQIAPQYSIGDLTNEVYAISLCLYGLPLRFLFTKPSLWWAFVDVCFTCVAHLRSSVSVIPSIGVNHPAIVREIPQFGLFPAFPHFCENVPHFWLYFETPTIYENRNKFSCTETFCSKKLYENANDSVT